jgi:hypothetical protein
VRVTFTVLLSPLAEFVPFTVSVHVPRAEDCVFTESCVVPEVVTDPGENEALLPEGSADTLKATAPVYPF